jgi:iron complex outermembrane recepter protein
MSKARIWRRLGLACTCLVPILACAAQGEGDTATTGALKQMSLEQLMDIQVTSVARHPESILQSPASVQVITREDIRRSGASTVGEALRLADNLQVAQKDSHGWGISARGFNAALANKLLVMIDGRTVYTPLFSGVFWDVQDYLLEDVERIEVVSGPGGTLWGANAVNGIINIITRSTADSHGIYTEGGGGNQLHDFAAARYGGTLAQDVNFRVYAKYSDYGDEVFADGRRAGDGWHQEQGGFRVDSVSARDNVSVHGDLYSALINGTSAQGSGGNLVGRWNRELTDRSDLSVQAYYDHTHLVSPIVALLLDGVELAPGGLVHDTLDTYDIDFQHRVALGNVHRIVWGAAYRRTHDEFENAPSLGLLPNILNQDRFSAFVQDEIRLAARWSIIVGTKIEHNDYTGFEFEPNVRAQWSVSPGQSIWSAISRAARTPSRFERDLVEPSPPKMAALMGSRAYTSEYVTAYELGYKGQLSSNATASASAFYNQYRDVRSISPSAGGGTPFFFANNLMGHTGGLELTANWQILDFWSAHAGYNFLGEHLHLRAGQTDINAGLEETADPRHQFALRSSMNLLGRVELDAALRWVDTLRTNNGPVPAEVPAYFELDGRIGWRLAPQLELSLVGQNLLHGHHPEYGFLSPTTVQIERSIYGKIAWRH